MVSSSQPTNPPNETNRGSVKQIVEERSAKPVAKNVFEILLGNGKADSKKRKAVPRMKRPVQQSLFIIAEA